MLNHACSTCFGLNLQSRLASVRADWPRLACLLSQCKMALIVPSDESEKMLHLEDQLDSEGLHKEQWTKPSFSRALLLLVIGVLVCLVSVATVRLSKLSSFKVFSGTASTASTALWDEFMDFGFGNELDRYRRQVSNDLNGDNDHELVSWHTVLCHAMEDNKVRIVQEVARRYQGSLQGGALHTKLHWTMPSTSAQIWWRCCCGPVKLFQTGRWWMWLVNSHHGIRETHGISKIHKVKQAPLGS